MTRKKKVARRKKTSGKPSGKLSKLLSKGNSGKEISGAEGEKISEVDVPDDKVVKLSERDALRFGKVDAEVRNAIQGQRLIDYQITELQQKAEAKIKELQGQKARLIAMVESHEQDYKALIEELAKTYGIPDHKKMAIDPDNGTVRDLSTT